MADTRQDHLAEMFPTDTTGNGSQPPSSQKELGNQTTPIQAATRKTGRKDQGQLHVTRHGILSRHLLEALRTRGEDVKSIRRLERQFRASLRPTGVIANLIFDRFFSCYLRLVLAARVEANAVAPSSTNESGVMPSVREYEFPTLIVPDGCDDSSIHLRIPADQLNQLVLVQRYDRHFPREMYRSLSLLLVMRDGGEVGLQEYVAQIVGVGKN
jgi:hypothetical protein